MFKQLSTIMDKTLQLHQQMLALMEKKREVVISGQIDALHGLLKEESDLIKQLEEAEQERLHCVQQIVPTAGDARHISLSQLLEQMDDRDRVVIQGQMKQLLQIIEQLKNENERNKTLVNESLQHVHQTLNILTADPTDDYTYKPDQPPAANSRSASGVFDRKV